MRVVDVGDDHLGGLATDAGDGHQAGDVRVVDHELLKFRFDGFHLLDEVIESSELQVELAFPNVAGVAIDDGFSEGVNVGSSGTPRPLTGVDLDATVGEDAADVVLKFGDVLVECFSVLDDGSLLSHFGLGNVHGDERVEHRHLGELEGIVAIGLSLGVLPGPGLFVGAADDGGQAFFLADVVNPSRRPAGFHDDLVDAFGCQ